MSEVHLANSMVLMGLFLRGVGSFVCLRTFLCHPIYYLFADVILFIGPSLSQVTRLSCVEYFVWWLLCLLLALWNERFWVVSSLVWLSCFLLTLPYCCCAFHGGCIKSFECTVFCPLLPIREWIFLTLPFWVSCFCMAIGSIFSSTAGFVRYSVASLQQITAPNDQPEFWSSRPTKKSILSNDFILSLRWS